MAATGVDLAPPRTAALPGAGREHGRKTRSQPLLRGLMALLPADSLKIIAESLGIPNLSDEIAKALAPDVEYRLREIAQEALKFMRHSKREVLTTDDVNSALRLRNVEALYGFTSNTDPLNFCRAAGTNDLFFIDDKELDFSEIVNAALPACPRDISLQLHWLAVEGVQPAIPQNPSVEVIAKRRKAVTPLEKNPEIKPIVKHVISKELQLYLFVLLPRFILGAEPSGYYEKITEAIKGTDEQLKTAALGSLANDPGLHQLVPYFAQFISDETTKSLRKTAVLLGLMKMVRALFDSPHIHIELYLHQIMPAILTCLVGKRLCEKPEEDHWSLRDYAADLVAFICKKWGDAYTTLQPRITKTLVHAFLDPAKPLTTHYGAIRGLSGLGHNCIQLLILPNLGAYMKELQSELKSADSVRQAEAKLVKEALMKACSTLLKAAAEEAKAAAAGAGPKVAAPPGLLGPLDTAKLQKECKDLFGPEFEA